MAYCWACNTQVQFGSNGWVCPHCGRHGRPDLIASDWEEGRFINAPYMEKPDATK